MGGIKFLELSQCQDLIVDLSLDCVEFFWLAARLWCHVPLRSFHVRVHEQLVDHCFRLIWVFGHQVQVFHWHGCDVGRLVWCWYAKLCQSGVGIECDVWLFGLVTWIVVFSSSRSTNAGKQANTSFA